MINAILAAGGKGVRFGGAEPKQFQLLAGVPLLVWAARRLAALPGLTRVIVVAAPVEHARCAELLDPLRVPLRLAAAGEERQQSVAAGLAAIEPSCELVVVHDAARPLVAASAVARCIDAARATGAAILATPVADTVKRAERDRIIATIPRADLWLAQTPQVFRADLLRRAHAEAARLGIVATDDAALVERLGEPVTLVAGSHVNRKITTPEDLAWAEAMLAGFPELRR